MAGEGVLTQFLRVRNLRTYGPSIMQDIIMSSTDEFDLDVLNLITAFSKLSLKGPPIYQVPNGIPYILFRLVCAGPPSLETLKQVLALTHVCGSWRTITIIPHL
ncbi:hypothetical protein K443DRAFT_681279 [Laccaria amethystina LaAM-08-1]|uniref:Uncharacterized protein n=1 Tax=Laccaria amethystina LaAM-08-1 TaxID=1095629 RepID=A0A0C9XP48_9AGAR|nr:hypothetical protein K443DRAFT_681279 [Laccaria amethystina LaAM-08-1]